jgi:hypothetical protein
MRIDDRTPPAARRLLAAVMVDWITSSRSTTATATPPAMPCCANPPILMRTCRATDIPVRFGGEEFIVFMVGARRIRGAELAERIRSHIERHPFDLGNDRSLQVTASLGVAQRQAGESLDELIRRADEALYIAKQNGRNQVRLAELTSAD